MDDGGFVFATLPGDGPVIGPARARRHDAGGARRGRRADRPPRLRRRRHRAAARRRRCSTRRPCRCWPARPGHDIVTSSGDTLLGADDKAGVAEIMAAVAHLAAHPELPRPTLRVGFTPDEEIGLGATRFDLERFGATCAYTLDGSQPGELQDETFSAIGITVTFNGVDVHPGWATGKLVNATRLAGRFLAALPPELTPEATRDREGFVHAYEVDATTARAVIKLIARDFDERAARAARRARAPHGRGGGGRRGGRGQAAVLEHARAPRRLPGGRGARGRGDPRRGPGRRPRADPRRHRRLDPQRPRPADPEPLHRRPRVPLAARMGVACRTWRRPPPRSCASPRPGRASAACAPACARPPRRPSARRRGRARAGRPGAAGGGRRARSCRPSGRSRSSPPTRPPAPRCSPRP